MPAEIRIASGRVAGTSDGPVRVWRGIPYAAAPIGRGRWRAPQPMRAWPGVRDATRFGADSVQAPMPASRAPSMSEDCLYANVWSPADAAPGERPVMVWLHGGGFVGGSGADARCEGTALAQPRRRRRHVQLSRRPVRLSGPSGAERGSGRPLRQLRPARSARRAGLGARQHRRVRRRPGAGDGVRRLGRLGRRSRCCSPRPPRRASSIGRSCTAPARHGRSPRWPMRSAPASPSAPISKRCADCRPSSCSA